MPVPENPRFDPRDLTRNRIYFLLSLVLAGGVVYRLWDKGLLTEEEERPVVKGTKRKSKRPQIIAKKPSASADIPDDVPYLLIGGGAATFSAFRAIKLADPQAKVLVITNEPYTPYMRPPLSKEMFSSTDRQMVQNMEFKQTDGSPRSIFFEDETYYLPCTRLKEEENGGVALAQGWTVKKLEVTKKTAILEDGKEIKYGKCLLAVGSKPKNIAAFEDLTPDVDERVTFYRGIFDFEELDEIVTNGAKSIVIVGGGFLGSELACSLAKRGRGAGLSVTQIFPEKNNMSKVLPEYLGRWTMKMIRNEGVQVLPDSKVDQVYMVKDQIQVLLCDGKVIPADQVVVAVGAEPNTELAKISNLEVDESLGGFVANAELEARTDLYVAGDCVCFYDETYGRRRIEHHDNAIVSGRLAGENMVKEVGNPYKEQAIFWSDLGPNISFEAIGLVDPSLPTVGIYAKTEEEDVEEVMGDDEEKDDPNEKYTKGVVFYLKDDIVVGIVLWNVLNKLNIAKHILKQSKKYDDLNELAKLFSLH
ncbi:hypothetical protein AAG570_001288 [Ranatra chinensis]|uniref:Uncharacterized protein n=1 Tax=Ranatra chinensis TaxID=642074 RepID=A0ABD0YZL4_9HEMI